MHHLQRFCYTFRWAYPNKRNGFNMSRHSIRYMQFLRPANDSLYSPVIIRPVSVWHGTPRYVQCNLRYKM